MAIGDDATAAGYPLVPGTGSDTSKVQKGAQEINRTRDFIAQVGANIPTSKTGYRTASGITSGTGDPTGGTDGDIYFKIIT